MSEAGARAMQQVKELSHLKLDEMLAANAFAALTADAESRVLRDKTVL